MAIFSTLLWLIDRNIAPGRCTEWTEEKINKGEDRYNPTGAFRRPEEVARILVNACAQYAVVERLAEEWDLIGSGVRTRFTDLAKRGWRSGNVTKGLLRLNERLHGKILTRKYAESTSSYEEFHGRTSSARDSIKDKFVRLPADYQSWSPERKKKYQQQLARERREQREY